MAEKGPGPAVTPSRLSKLYRSTILKSYFFGFVGFIIGLKVCDWAMYDARKHEVEIEMLEEEFWMINGVPKYIKPQLLESVVHPGKVRQSWIQVVYGKDSYVTKEQAED